MKFKFGKKHRETQLFQFEYSDKPKMFLCEIIASPRVYTHALQINIVPI
jgi:hypothetical protein